MKRSLRLTCAALALLSGCSLIPDYQRPDSPVSQTWPQGPAYQNASGASQAPTWDEVGWKQFFVDPALQQLIQQSLDNNRDLRVAALNIEVARATYRVTRADLLPNVDGGASMSMERTPRDLSQSVPPQSYTSRTYKANLGVTSFELDLFGRLHSLEEQALQSYLATEQARDSTRISLIAEVANAYLTWLGDRKLLTLTEDTLKTRQETLSLTQRSYERGIGSQLDVAQAETAVRTAEANRLLYLRQVAQDKNALELVVGAPVDEKTLPDENLDSVKLVEDMPVGLSSGVLLRRPDIAQAEFNLKAANANIGAARAAFFPTISLTGAAGLASPYLGGLFQGKSASWSFAPQASVPIFDAGRNQANLDSAKASRDIAVATYEKSIQTAFREVSDALAAKGTLTDQLRTQEGLVKSSQTYYDLSRARYDRGVDSYMTVLDSQRSLYSAQQDLVSTQVSRLSNLVTLYKVLGGGRV